MTQRVLHLRRIFHALWQQPWHSRWLSLQIFILLPLVSVMLRLIGFRRSYGVLAKSAPAPSRADDWKILQPLTDALLVALLVERVANNAPYTAVCLSRSLVLWWLLRRQGIVSTLRIGVRNDSCRFEAHAWVEYDGFVLNDTPTIQDSFAPFDASILASLESRA